MRVLDAPSPNHGPRRDGLRPSLVVLHYTAMESADAALERLCDPKHEVSCHYLIGKDGRVWQLVDEDLRAWHAGAGSWGGMGDVNSRSIGIELDNRGTHPFSAPLMAALVELLPGIMKRHGIDPAGVIGHSDMAPDRKNDPGPRFDWKRLARAGHAVWPRTGTASGDDLQARFSRAACVFGYPDQGDVLSAFRARFRPRARGEGPDRCDVAMIEDLAARHPFLDPGHPAA